MVYVDGNVDVVGRASTLEDSFIIVFECSFDFGRMIELVVSVPTLMYITSLDSSSFIITNLLLPVAIDLSAGGIFELQNQHLPPQSRRKLKN